MHLFTARLVSHGVPASAGGRAHLRPEVRCVTSRLTGRPLSPVLVSAWSPGLLLLLGLLSTQITNYGLLLNLLPV